MPMNKFHYFAYGSNMLLRRITARTPSAVVFAKGYVAGRRLTFHKLSKDGSGKCDAELTGNDTDLVYGVVFEILNDEKPALDHAEGLGYGYEESTVEVVTTEQRISATTYVATNKRSAIRPYRWYKALTIAGAIENQLPMSYVEWIRAVESKEDPDETRRKDNEALLFDAGNENDS